MPNVGGVEYPYTPEGVAAAQEHARQIQKTGPLNLITRPYMPQPFVGLDPSRSMSPPMTSPSHPMAQRQVPDLQPGPWTTHSAWRGAASRSPSAPWANAPTYEDRYTVQNDPNRYYGGTTSVGGDPVRGQTYPESPSNPWYQPVAPAPRGNVIETSGPANYGSSPSNPNWGQDTGGRSIQKMGPQMLPQSNVQAISPQNRINANIRAVMSGQQGPSPGTSPTGQAPARPPSYKPWQNQFGPTGQPVSRTPLQKDNMVNNVVKQLPGG